MAINTNGPLSSGPVSTAQTTVEAEETPVTGQSTSGNPGTYPIEGCVDYPVGTTIDYGFGPSGSPSGLEIPDLTVGEEVEFTAADEVVGKEDYTMEFLVSDYESCCNHILKKEVVAGDEFVLTSAETVLIGEGYRRWQIRVVDHEDAPDDDQLRDVQVISEGVVHFVCKR